MMPEALISNLKMEVVVSKWDAEGGKSKLKGEWEEVRWCSVV